MNITRSFPNNAKGTDFKWPMLFLILLAIYATSFLDCLKIQVKSCPFNWQWCSFQINTQWHSISFDYGGNSYVTAFPLNVVIQSFARIRSSACSIWSLGARSTNVHCYMASVSSFDEESCFLVYLCLTFSQNFPFQDATRRTKSNSEAVEHSPMAIAWPFPPKLRARNKMLL